MTGERLAATIPASLAGSRLDHALVEVFPQFSRARLQRWIRDGDATVDRRRCRPRDRVSGGERVELHAHLNADSDPGPETIDVPVVYRDEDLIVVDKPPGLVVHPGAGNRGGTLVNALLALDPGLAGLPRAGLVHRLDKDTSGLLVVARNLAAHKHLVDALGRREIRREYAALAWGEMRASMTIEAPIGRHRVHRKRMAVVEGGRAARTYCHVAERFQGLTLLDVVLDTGRTHQIRVHLAHVGHPVAGDPTYGGRRVRAGLAPGPAEALRALTRQALHASRLTLAPPAGGAPLRLESPLPPDMAALLAALRG